MRFYRYSISKYIPKCDFIGNFIQKYIQNTIFKFFLLKIHQKCDFIGFLFKKTDLAGGPIDRSDRSEKKVGGLGGLSPQQKAFFLHFFSCNPPGGESILNDGHPYLL